MSSQADLYLRGAFEMNPSPTAPGPAAALDTLLRLTHQMQDMPFTYTWIDKPRSGTSAVVWHDPSRPHWPSDGIRYLSQAQMVDDKGLHQSGEKFSTSSHPLPNNVAGIVELETGVVSGGIFPPSNPAIPLSQDSPDLQLARYRIRWRIVTPGLGNLALWLVYWGRDERATQRAPPGWEREPIRRYPLPALPPNIPPEQPLRTGRALPPPPLLEPSYPPSSASPPPPLPSMQQHMQQHPNRQTSFSTPQPQPHHPLHPPQHQQHPSIPPNMQLHQQQQPPSHMMYQQARQPSMPLGPPPGSAHGPQAQVPHSQQPQQQQQIRRNTPKQSHATVNKKLTQQSLGKANSQAHPPPPNSAVAAAVQPQIQALQAVPPHLRPIVAASAAHSSFPQPFSDPYDYLSSRSWAGLRYEHNHAVVAPIFDPSTTSELIESWIEPSFPDLEKIQEEISLLQKEVEALKARQLQLPGKPGLASTTGNDSTAPPSSQQLARKTSVASGGLFRSEKDNLRQKDFDALLAPMPRMMPIAEMHDKAMQAHNARRKEIEDALQAQRAAKEEEQRAERERIEAEEAAKRAIEEEAREKERREREAKEAEERRQKQAEEDEKVAKEAATAPAEIKAEGSTSKQGHAQGNARPEQQQPQQHQQQHQQQQQQSAAGDIDVEEQPQEGNAETYFDDSYSLLMDNFGMYGNGGGYNAGMSNDEIMDDSLFSEYMDQMGSM